MELWSQDVAVALSKAAVSRLFYLQASNKHNPLMVCTVYSEYWEPENNNKFADLNLSQVYENYANIENTHFVRPTQNTLTTSYVPLLF